MDEVNELNTEKKLANLVRQYYLSEKGIAGTDVSFKSPVVTAEEYHSIMRKAKENYGKKKKFKGNPFKDPIKKLEEKKKMKEWDKLLEYVDKNFERKKADAILEDYSKQAFIRKVNETLFGRLTDI